MRRTPSQTVGPYYAIGLERREQNVLDPNGVELHGRLLDGRGEGIGDGMIEVFDSASRRWGRCGTRAEGDYRFVVPGAGVLEAYVFARGLLRHQLVRIPLDDAHRDGDGFRFDIRMQGAEATQFLEH